MNRLTIYHIVPGFSDRPSGKGLLKTLWEKKKMLVTSIFFFSHNVFLHLRDKFNLWSMSWYYFCKYYEFRPGWNFVKCGKELKIILTRFCYSISFLNAVIKWKQSVNQFKNLFLKYPNTHMQTFNWIVWNVWVQFCRRVCYIVFFFFAEWVVTALHSSFFSL